MGAGEVHRSTTAPGLSQRPCVHPQHERCQLVGLASMASFNKEHSAHTLNLPPYQHCICNQLRFAKTVHTPQPVSATWAVHCWAITATACDEPGMTAVCRSGLTRHQYMRETGVLCDLTPLQLPVRRSTSQGPNHSCTA